MTPSIFRDDIVEAIESRLMFYPEVSKGRMFGHPGFSIQNRFFCFAYEDGLALKLPRGDYESILKLDEAEPFKPDKSAAMGTWAVLTYPEANDYLDNWSWIEKAMAYIVTDEAAPPKKRKKSGKQR